MQEKGLNEIEFMDDECEIRFLVLLVLLRH